MIFSQEIVFLRLPVRLPAIQLRSLFKNPSAVEPNLEALAAFAQTKVAGGKSSAAFSAPLHVSPEPVQETQEKLDAIEPGRGSC